MVDKSFRWLTYCVLFALCLFTARVNAQVNITEYRMVYNSAPYAYDTGWSRDVQSIGESMEAYLNSNLAYSCQSPDYVQWNYEWAGSVGGQGEFKRNVKYFSGYNCTTVSSTATTKMYIQIQTRVIQGCPPNLTAQDQAFICYTPGSIALADTTMGNCEDQTRIPNGTTPYTYSSSDFGRCVVTLTTLHSVARNPNDETEYWRGLWGNYTLTTTGQLPSDFNPEPPGIPEQYARPPTPPDAEEQPPGGDGTGDGTFPNLNWGSFSGPSGSLYTGRGVTLQDVLETRKPQLLATPIVGAMATFFTVTHAGQCMPWAIPGTALPWGHTLVFDFHCSETALNMFVLIRAALLLVAAFFAFRIAIE